MSSPIQAVEIPAQHVLLQGDFAPGPDGAGIVIFAHGSGSSRHSPRNQFVARTLQQADLGTLLFDLLTEEEEAVDERTAQLRFDIQLLATRLVAATDWLIAQPGLANRKIGYFGSSTGGGAALVAAAERPDVVAAVVSRGGRPDLAGASLPRVKAATLLLVGGRDEPVIELNQEAMRSMSATVKLEIVPGATHLFSEPGTLEAVAVQAAAWFRKYLA